MNNARVEVTLVPHGFEVDIWHDSEDPPGQKRVAGYCFDFGGHYPKLGLVADRLACFLVKTLREEPNWLCSGAANEETP